MMAETLAQATSSTGNCVSIVSIVKNHYGYIMLELLLQTYIIVLCSIVLLFMIRIAFLLPPYFETAGPLPQEFQSSSGVRILTLAL